MTELALLRDHIAALMQDATRVMPDDAFNDIAMRVFRFQFDNNAPYRKYCERRRVSPGDANNWLDIPAVPTAAFKEAVLVSGDFTAVQATFRTSGTTQGSEKRGSHHIIDLELYEHSLLPAFKHFVLSGRAEMPIVSLVPAWHDGAESSLSYMVSTVMRELGTPDSCFVISDSGIDYGLLHDWMLEHANADSAVCILGTSLAFVHWFDHMKSNALELMMPAGSRIMDTGGFKGSTRATTSEELRLLYARLLGIDRQHVVNEYGMTEMLSQFYDADLAVKRGPPWVKSAVVDPETLKPLPPGTTGLLRHCDLANLFSVSAIQTEDIGIMRGSGFELLGRTAGAAPRGCSIAMDLFLSSTRA